MLYLHITTSAMFFCKPWSQSQTERILICGFSEQLKDKLHIAPDALLTSTVAEGPGYLDNVEIGSDQNLLCCP